MTTVVGEQLSTDFDAGESIRTATNARPAAGFCRPILDESIAWSQRIGRGWCGTESRSVNSLVHVGSTGRCTQNSASSGRVQAKQVTNSPVLAMGAGPTGRHHINVTLRADRTPRQPLSDRGGGYRTRSETNTSTKHDARRPGRSRHTVSDTAPTTPPRSWRAPP